METDGDVELTLDEQIEEMNQLFQQAGIDFMNLRANPSVWATVRNTTIPRLLVEKGLITEEELMEECKRTLLEEMRTLYPQMVRPKDSKNDIAIPAITLLGPDGKPIKL